MSSEKKSVILKVIFVKKKKKEKERKEKKRREKKDKKKCNLKLAVSPTYPQHKPSAYLLATFSITSQLL